MVQGRKPLPTAVHEMTGAYDKNPKRRRKKEPKSPKTEPKCPAYLDRMAKHEWKVVTGMLRKLNILSEVDTTALSMYCQTYSDWRKAVKVTAKEGAWTVCTDKEGNIFSRRHEWDRVRERNMEACRKWLCEFGLTPSSRARVQVEEEVKNDFDSFLSRFN